jgi:nitroimidazol reductase NimA-like FMN-containing flavoprotein (pyridoxamine 5'-phosphate oxidase superfamily)
MSLAMTKAERERFLADTHVGIVSVADDGRGPLSVPIWYRYEPGGELRFVTGGSSRKVDRIRKAGRITVCVQSETMPYRYVTVEGPVSIDAPDFERDVREVAIRYLGAQMGETYLAATTAEHAGAIVVALRPAHWSSADFAKWGG